MPAPALVAPPRPRPPRGFTLTELLLVMAILVILAGLALSALSGATELARAQRTRAIINKIDQLIMERYESYLTRSVPVPLGQRYPATTNPRVAALNRLNVLRELMRMELPDRVTDVFDPPATGIPPPAVWYGYRRRASAALGGAFPSGWTTAHEGSECLYLILGSMHDGDKQALDFFTPDEIGDTDGDGMKEILDGWGQPIEFLRWAPGFLPDEGAIEHAITTQDPSVPDPFDPLKVDPRWTDPNARIKPFALRPLIFSAGPDRRYDIATQLVDGSGNPFHYSTTSPLPNDPYYVPTANGQKPLGTPFDADGDGHLSFADNLTNHYQEVP